VAKATDPVEPADLAPLDTVAVVREIRRSRFNGHRPPPFNGERVKVRGKVITVVRQNVFLEDDLLCVCVADGAYGVKPGDVITVEGVAKSAEWQPRAKTRIATNYMDRCMTVR
jgi:hypothetical protein